MPSGVSHFRGLGAPAASTEDGAWMVSASAACRRSVMSLPRLQRQLEDGPRAPEKPLGNTMMRRMIGRYKGFRCSQRWEGVKGSVRAREGLTWSGIVTQKAREGLTTVSTRPGTCGLPALRP